MAENLIDPAALDDLVEDIGADEVADLLDVFLDDVPQQLELLSDGLDAGDCAMIGRVAHTLKSTSALVGADDAASRLRELESAAEAGDLDRLRETAPEVTRQLGLVCDELRAVGERLGGQT
jgi:HPt (histidine-containing phosphotransfer) domain-containing protein